MHSFTLPDMSCGHCVGAISKALQTLDAECELNFDLPAHQLQVASHLSREQLAEALTEAGYPPA